MVSYFGRMIHFFSYNSVCVCAIVRAYLTQRADVRYFLNSSFYSSIHNDRLKEKKDTQPCCNAQLGKKNVENRTREMYVSCSHELFWGIPFHSKVASLFYWLAFLLLLIFQAMASFQSFRCLLLRSILNAVSRNTSSAWSRVCLLREPCLSVRAKTFVNKEALN